MGQASLFLITNYYFSTDNHSIDLPSSGNETLSCATFCLPFILGELLDLGLLRDRLDSEGAAVEGAE